MCEVPGALGLSQSVQNVKVKIGSFQNLSREQDCDNIAKDGRRRLGLASVELKLAVKSWVGT